MTLNNAKNPNNQNMARQFETIEKPNRSGFMRYIFEFNKLIYSHPLKHSLSSSNTSKN